MKTSSAAGALAAGVAASAKSFLPDRSHGLSGRSVLVIGVLLVLAIGGIGVVTYRTCRSLMHQSVARDNLMVAEAFAGVAAQQIQSSDIRPFLSAVQDVWQHSSLEERSFALAVFDQDGRIVLHTRSPDPGSFAALPVEVTTFTATQPDATVLDLLQQQQSVAGRLAWTAESPELAGLYFEPSVNGLLAVSVPTSAIDQEFQRSSLPWLAALCFAGGILVPGLLGLLYVQNQRSVLTATEQFARLKVSELRYRRLYQHSPYCVHEIDADGRVVSMNRAGLQMLDLSCEADVIGRTYLSLVCVGDRERIGGLMADALGGRTCHFEFQSDAKPVKHYRSCFIPIAEPDDHQAARLMGLTEDVSEQVHSQNVIRTENEMLSFAAVGHATDYILEQLIRSIEGSDESLLTCVYMVDEDSERLKLAASGCLPDDFYLAVAKVKIGEGVGSCGTAAYRGEPVFVDDIQSDPLWSDYCHLAKASNVAACSSIPILAGDGSVLGTFACYRRASGPLSEKQLYLLNSAAHLAGLAISRRRALSQLREQEAIFRSIFDQAAVGVTHVETATGRLIRVNRKYAEILDATVDELVGRNWMELTHPDDLPTGQKNVQRMMTGEIRQYSVEKRLLSLKDQRPIWIKLTVSTMWAPADQAATHISIAEDITDSKQAQQALLLSEKRHRSLVTSSAAIIWTTDATGQFSAPQPSWERYTGQSWHAHQGDGWKQMLHIDDVQRIAADWTQAVRAPRTFQTDVRIYHAGRATYRHCEVRATPIFDEDNQVVEWVGSTVDVHDRRLAEAALRDSEQRYRAVVNDLSEFIVRWKPNGIRTFVNDAYCRCFGETAEEMLGTSFFPLIEKSDLQNVQERLSRLSPAQPNSSATHKVLLPDGTTGWHEWTDRALFDDADQLLGYQSVGRDITDRKRVEQQLRESEKKLRLLNASLEQRVVRRTQKLQRANEDLEAYARSVAHDLRAPLRAITGFAMALQEDCAEQLDEHGGEYIQFIVAAASQMDDLICDLLTYSRIGKSGMSLDRQDLDEIFTIVQSQLTKDIRQTAADIRVQKPLGSIVGHRSTLVQLFSNLLSNALKFVPNGTRPRVQVFSRSADGFLRISVRDNGIGISPEAHDSIFRVFERLHGIETYPGTGVGLAIVRRAAETFGGRFGVESSLGDGSLFWVELPCQEPAHV